MSIGGRRVDWRWAILSAGAVTKAAVNPEIRLQMTWIQQVTYAECRSLPLPTVTNRYQPLPTVTVRCLLLPTVACRIPPLHTVTCRYMPSPADHVETRAFLPAGVNEQHVL